MIEIRNRKSSRWLYTVYADTLAGVDLRGAHLFRADLAGQNLRGANFCGADLREATLAGSDLTGAALGHSVLYRADFAGARLRGADLRGARMQRARLAGADLSDALLADAWYTRRMHWPAEVDPQAAGAWIEEREEPNVGALYQEILGVVPRWVIAWGRATLAFHFNPQYSAPSGLLRLGLRVCPPLSDWLEFGPQHVDLTLQNELRKAYLPEADRSLRQDLQALDAFASALSTGEPVLFWCDPQLGCCLAFLWALDALHQRGVEMSNAALLFWPTTPGMSPPSAPAIRRAFHQVVPVPDVLQPLIALRCRIASDSDSVSGDLPDLPDPAREWAAVTAAMADYLPDERGLDVADAHLLSVMDESWRSGSQISGRFPRPHDAGWGVLYSSRLRELCGGAPFDEAGFGSPDGMLARARFHPGDRVLHARFRITPLGARVRAGEADALAPGCFRRWVGGRLVSRDRPLRRQVRACSIAGLHPAPVPG